MALFFIRITGGGMNDKNGETPKIFVDQEGMAVIECPACSIKKITRVNSAAIREKSQRDHCLVRCTCQTKFAVKLEFRRDYRKDSNFTGEFVALPKGKPRGEATIANISQHGFGLEIAGSAQFGVGDQILVLFNLDGNEDALIEKRATIRYVKDNYIGCEFLGSFPLGKSLGSFLAGESAEQLEEEELFDWANCSLK